MSPCYFFRVLSYELILIKVGSTTTMMLEGIGICDESTGELWAACCVGNGRVGETNGWSYEPYANIKETINYYILQIDIIIITTCTKYLHW